MKRFLLAALLAIAGLASAQTAVTIAPGGSVSVTCAPATTPAPLEPKPTEPAPPPPATDACAGMSQQFMAALAERPPLTLWDIQLYRNGGLGLTDEERACARARNVPGSAIPPPAGNSSDPTIPTTGLVFGGQGNPLRNHLRAGVTYDFVLQSTAEDEIVRFTHGEMPGTPDSMTLTIWVLGPGGQVLYGPQNASSRIFSMSIPSPGGRLTYRIKPSEDGWLMVQRN